jgi:hypothetical protein
MVPPSGSGFDSTPNLNLVFLHGGWNLVAKLNATNLAVSCSYVRDTDLSGTPQGTGGVGGLLAVRRAKAPRRQLKQIELRLVKVET